VWVQALAVPVRWASLALLSADIYNLLLGFIPNAKNSNQGLELFNFKYYLV
jgi:hypothetical protein